MTTPNLRAGIRNDKIRKLYDLALAHGWVGAYDGRGHIQMTAPDGRRFWISSTHNGGSMGHHYENTKAKARRAGLDVTSLDSRSPKRASHVSVSGPTRTG